MIGNNIQTRAIIQTPIKMDASKFNDILASLENMTDAQRDSLMGHLAQYIIVPQWYNKEYIEEIAEKEISKDKYDDIMRRCEKCLPDMVNDLVKHVIDMTCDDEDEDEEGEDEDDEEA